MQPKQPQNKALQNEAAEPGGSPFGDLIFSYTRAQAIEDGVLIDVSETARECGFVLPVALTQAAWAVCVGVPGDTPGQDESGRLWDLLTLLRFEICKNRGQATSRVDFSVSVQQSPRKRERVALYALCGPGDDGEAVITVMLPNED